MKAQYDEQMDKVREQSRLASAKLDELSTAVRNCKNCGNGGILDGLSAEFGAHLTQL